MFTIIVILAGIMEINGSEVWRFIDGDWCSACPYKLVVSRKSQLAISNDDNKIKMLRGRQSRHKNKFNSIYSIDRKHSMAYVLTEKKSGWKICKDASSNGYVLVELSIPAGTVIYQPNMEANPVCGQAITIEFWRGEIVAEDVKRATSFMTYDTVIYERGITTTARQSYHDNPDFDGLHFFWTREDIKREAPRYNLPSHVIWWNMH